MATGMVDNWVNVDVFGPIYPFVGTEVLLSLIGIALWIAWHVWQVKAESAEFEADMETINRRGGIGKMLDD